MQIGTVTNQYINNYHNTAAVQTYNAQQVRQVQDMSETRLMEYHQEQYREQQRWLDTYIHDDAVLQRKYVVTIMTNR